MKLAIECGIIFLFAAFVTFTISHAVCAITGCALSP